MTAGTKPSCCVWADRSEFVEHHNHMLSLSPVELAGELVDVALDYGDSETHYKWLSPEDFPEFVAVHDFDDRAVLYRVARRSMSIWEDALRERRQRSSDRGLS